MNRFTWVLFFFICFVSCTSQADKINGVSFVAAPDPALQEHVDPIVNISANYAAIMPFGFIRNLESPQIVFDTERQWFGETRAGADQYIDLLHSNNITVMIKPQIWIRRGEFTGYLMMNSEADWRILEVEYRKFILNYAELAAEKDVAIFCIGTELEQFIVNRPEYWYRLISEIKEIFPGKLTYAANWDEYKRVPFWDKLDYIGVDAYFPISDSKTPTVVESREGWQKWKQEMIGLSKQFDKKILFAEYGYRSLDFAGKEPWVSDYSLSDVNLDAQYNLLQAMYDEVWHEEWFAGGFIWKWFIHNEKVGGLEDPQFTPQNKPAEEVIKTNYHLHR